MHGGKSEPFQVRPHRPFLHWRVALEVWKRIRFGHNEWARKDEATFLFRPLQLLAHWKASLHGLFGNNPHCWKNPPHHGNHENIQWVRVPSCWLFPPMSPLLDTKIHIIFTVLLHSVAVLSCTPSAKMKRIRTMRSAKLFLGEGLLTGFLPVLVHVACSGSSEFHCNERLISAEVPRESWPLAFYCVEDINWFGSLLNAFFSMQKKYQTFHLCSFSASTWMFVA